MENDTKKCPYCGKEIKAVAKKCKHCGEWIDDNNPHKQSPSSVGNDNQKAGNVSAGKNRQWMYIGIGGIAVVLIILAVLVMNGTTSYTYDNIPEIQSLTKYDKQTIGAKLEKAGYVRNSMTFTNKKKKIEVNLSNLDRGYIKAITHSFSKYSDLTSDLKSKGYKIISKDYDYLNRWDDTCNDNVSVTEIETFESLDNKTVKTVDNMFDHNFIFIIYK